MNDPAGGREIGESGGDTMNALTDEEIELVKMLGSCWNKLCAVVGRGPTREADLNEAVHHVHALQQMVLSQAAGRTYPDTFRLLGASLRDSERA